MMVKLARVSLVLIDGGVEDKARCESGSLKLFISQVPYTNYSKQGLEKQREPFFLL